MLIHLKGNQNVFIAKHLRIKQPIQLLIMPGVYRCYFDNFVVSNNIGQKIKEFS